MSEGTYFILGKDILITLISLSVKGDSPTIATLLGKMEVISAKKKKKPPEGSDDLIS